MGSEVLVRKGVIAEIVARAQASADEVCGLLLGARDQVTGVLHCRNVSPDRAVAFEIDPAQLIATFRAGRAGGPEVIGCYHSHPGGRPEPSPRDADQAAPNGWLWLIVAGGEARLWRAVADGERHGRFDPVPRVIPAKAGSHLPDLITR